MTSPYSDLPARAFWRTGVSDRAPLDPGDIYQPRVRLSPTDRIVTAGSCFAQHVGRALKGAGFNVVDVERAPPGMSDALANTFGYRLYSARYGNIYTTRQLLQLWQEATGRLTPALPVWERGGRYFDAFRPGVEPDGLDSANLVAQHRAQHLKAVKLAFRAADVIVFTFGLTEAWVHRDTQTVYPTAPGTIAGDHDPAVFGFRNYSYTEVIEDFRRFRAQMMQLNPAVRFIVTVSPVPLTATASGLHVEVASSYSKSVLRAVCGELYATCDNVDYFPSYEIITSQNANGAYYEANKRNVSPQGVETAMNTFKAAQIGPTRKPAAAPPRAARPDPAKERQRLRRAMKVAGQPTDSVCEEALLDAFRP